MGGRLTEGEGVCLGLAGRFSFGAKGSTVEGEVFRWWMSASFVRCESGTADRRLAWKSVLVRGRCLLPAPHEPPLRPGHVLGIRLRGGAVAISLNVGWSLMRPDAVGLQGFRLVPRILIPHLHRLLLRSLPEGMHNCRVESVVDTMSASVRPAC